MTRDLLFANNASTSLSQGIDEEETTFSLLNGSVFPDISSEESILLTLSDGLNLEIILVTEKVGDTVLDCIRGYEGTTASAFEADTLVENRLTANSVGNMARKIDRLWEIPDLSNLPMTPTVSNSILIRNTRNIGAPLLALRGDGNTLWSFPAFKEATFEGEVLFGSPTSARIDFTVPSVEPGKYIVQIKTGNNAGHTRFITASSSGWIYWNEPTPFSVVVGNELAVYKHSLWVLRELRNPASSFSLLFNPTDLLEESLTEP